MRHIPKHIPFISHPYIHISSPVQSDIRKLNNDEIPSMATIITKPTQNIEKVININPLFL